jgi:hemoglobin
MDSREKHYRELRARAAAVGVDEDYIDLLLETFYTRVQTHEVLAPIFEEAIGDTWDEHLIIIRSFWVSFIFGDGGYNRDMGAIHKNLTDVRPEHFAIWLDLFRSTLEDTAPTPQAVEFFMTRANRIAKGLQTIMYGRGNKAD